MSRDLAVLYAPAHWIDLSKYTVNEQNQKITKNIKHQTKHEKVNRQKQ